MERSRFLRNLRGAAGFLSPTAQANGIRLETEHVANLLRRATVWLTPKAVEGFDPADFPEMPAADRERLSRDVEQFAAIARGVPGDRPAGEEQVRDAVPVFQAILSAMGPYLEGFQVYAALKRQQFPGYVRDFAVKVGEDWTGDPATWIWVIVADHIIEDERKRRKLVAQGAKLGGLILDAFEQADIRLYPYMSFRSQSDQHNHEVAPSR